MSVYNISKKLKSSVLRYQFSKVGLRKGNVYEYLDDKITDWLIDEAIKIRSEDVGLVIAAIVKDAYAEEVGENDKSS